MKKTIQLGLLGIGLTIISLSQVSAQSIYHSKAEILKELTEKTTEEIYAEKELGKTYKEIAQENGVLEEFKEENLENTKEYLNEEVKEGEITQVEREQIIEHIEEHQANCDGTGNGYYHNSGHYNSEYHHRGYHHGNHHRR